jgi:hypothetical protein
VSAKAGLRLHNKSLVAGPPVVKFAISIIKSYS